MEEFEEILNESFNEVRNKTWTIRREQFPVHLFKSSINKEVFDMWYINIELRELIMQK